MENEKDIKIKELESKVLQEKAVKDSEVLLNKELLEKIERLELHNNTLLEINDKYSEEISKLKLQLKRFLFNRI
jgi:hypothetical protein